MTIDNIPNNSTSSLQVVDNEPAVLQRQSTNEPTYNLTILRASPSDVERGRRYAKNLLTNVIKFPYFNSYTTLQVPTFEGLYNTYTKLLERADATQILGIPTHQLQSDTDQNTQNTNRIRRTANNFDYYASDAHTESAFYGYLIVDIDRELPSGLLTNDFRSEYRSLSLSPETLEKQARRVLGALLDGSSNKEVITRDCPLIFRLSGSFGKSEEPKFRGHLIIPLTHDVPVTQMQVFLSQFDWVDITMYRNPTQPVFTSAPITTDEEQKNVDPLSTFNHDIKRLYYFDPTGGFGSGDSSNSYFPSSLINTSIVLANNPGRQKRGDYIPSTDLEGVRGVFNRASKIDDQYSISSWLIHHGYTPSETDSNRYISPDSTSGQPGLVIFDGGYIHDFHDTSPIRVLLDRHTKSSRATLTAYDLYRLDAKANNNLTRFKQQVESLCSADPKYQTYWETRIRDSVSFISEALTIPELESIVQALVEDIFRARLSQGRKSGIFNQMVRLAPKVDGYSVTLGVLNKIYSSLRHSLSQDLLEIHPDNKDYVNVRAYLSQSRIYRNSYGNYWLLESTKGDRMDLVVSTEEVQRRVSRSVRELSTDPNSWNLAKIQSTSKAIMHTITEEADDPDYKIPKPKDHIFAFPDSSEGINLFTKEIVDINLDTFVLQTLPFSKEQYLSFDHKRGIKETNWLAFLTSTFGTEPDRAKQLRDLFTYLLLPTRKTNLIYALVGLPRSGKSTIKNLIRDILGETRYMETSPDSLRDDFGLSRLTTETRLLIINEFNSSELRRRNGFNQHGGKIINTLKIISGRDEVIIREMRENPRTIRTDALPLILSNELPTISDRAFQNRLQVIKFDKMFAEEAERDTGKFYQSLNEELPVIFQWAATNPRLQPDGTFEFLRTEVGQRDKDDITQIMDVHGGFFRRFLVGDKEGWVSKKEVIHFFGCYFYKRRGFAPDEKELSPRSFGIDKLRNSFPYVSTSRAKATSTETLMNSDAPKYLKESLGNREWGFEGVRWKDLDAMIVELSEFSDYLS